MKTLIGDNMTDEIDPTRPESIPRNKLVVFFLIDSSSSMGGEKIGQVNDAIQEALPEIRNIGGSDADIYFAPLMFDSSARWVYPQPESVETATWNRIQASGATYMGAAFRMLKQKLSRTEYLATPHLSFAPVIMLLSDGYPNDDWRSGLNELKTNSWFKNSLRVAIGVGDEVDMTPLKEFVRDEELALHLKNVSNLSILIQKILITSSKIGGESNAFSSDNNSTDDFENKKKEEQLKTGLEELTTSDFLDNSGFN